MLSLSRSVWVLGWLVAAACTAAVACGDDSKGSSGTATTGGSAGEGAAESTGGAAGAGTGGATTGGEAPGGASPGGGGGGGAGGVALEPLPEFAGGAPNVLPTEVTRPKIMIVGDSISAGPGCYKKYLLQNLNANGYTQFDFVGEYTDDCGGGVRHSAVSCTSSASFTQDTFTVPGCFGTEAFPGLATLMTTHTPDVLMIQLGVNDVWGGSASIPNILANYTTLVEQARTANPEIVVVVAQIQKIISDNCTNAASTTNAEALVNAVPTWAAETSTPDSPVLVADLWTNSDPHESADCVHPNDAGARRMGLNWFIALTYVLQPDS